MGASLLTVTPPNDFELMILDHNKKNKIDAFSEKNVKISDEKEFDLNTKGGYLNLPNNVSRIATFLTPSAVVIIENLLFPFL